MTSTIKDGGCAYPCEYHRRSGMHSTEKVVAKGMSLRDYFAGQALAGDMANPGEGVFTSDANSKFLIERAVFHYRMADAMIAAREATK